MDILTDKYFIAVLKLFTNHLVWSLITPGAVEIRSPKLCDAQQLDIILYTLMCIVIMTVLLMFLGGQLIVTSNSSSPIIFDSLAKLDGESFILAATKFSIAFHPNRNYISSKEMHLKLDTLPNFSIRPCSSNLVNELSIQHQI